MHINDLDQFTETLTATMDVYGKSVSSMTIQVWWEALKKYDVGAVLTSFSEHIQNPDNGQFAPKPADIVRLIEGSTQDRALEAWAKVDKAMKRVGAFDSVVFDDAVIHLAITDMGGWIKICKVEDKEKPFTAKEFENRYRAHLSKGVTEYPKKLIGTAEASNSEAGYKIDPPILIGNQEKAEQLFIDGNENRSIAVTPYQGLELKRIA